MNTVQQNDAAICDFRRRGLFRQADRIKTESLYAPSSPPRSPWQLLVASLVIWRAFPAAFWLDPIEPRPNAKKMALDHCWLGCLGVLFMIVVANTWQLSYSMVSYPWLERDILALPLTSLWNIEEARLEYMPNLAAPHDAPWMQERIEDLWDDEVNVGWIDPLGSEEQKYYVDSMMEHGRVLYDPSWHRVSGDHGPNLLWAFCCTFKNIVPSVRLLLDPVVAWLAIAVAMKLLVRHVPSARMGAISLNGACMIPVRWAWIGAMIVGVTFLVAPDESRNLRSQAYLPLLVLSICGPVFVAIRPAWKAMEILRSGWGWRFRAFVFASILLMVTTLVISIDLAARYTGYIFFVKTGQWVGETSNFSLWL